MEHPDQLSERGESGRSPLEVALAGGDVFCIVALMRLNPTVANHRVNWREIVLDYISGISDTYFCSQWETGLELKLWMAVFENTNKLGFELAQRQKEDIEYLVLNLKEWPEYDGEIKWHSVNEWRRRQKG